MKKNLSNFRALSLTTILIRFLLSGALTFLIELVFVSTGKSQNPQTQNAADKYYFFTGNHPANATPSWGDAVWATGGLAHDNSHWYIASNRRDKWTGITTKDDWAIWRWPVSEDLNQDLDNGDHGVITFRLKTSRINKTFKKYGHIGDLDYCVSPNGVGYLVLPLTGDNLPPIIAFFRASDLHFINYSYLNSTQQTDIGWCAVHPNGDLYTSRDNAHYILRYHINWSRIAHHHDALTFDTAYHIPILHSMQGGEFTPDGELLYVNSGLLDCPFHSNAYPSDGIHVFETSNWHQVQRSTNQARNETGCFDYTFDNDNPYHLCFEEEPEGLTIWDLNDGRAPGVRGQLHVLVDDHSLYVPLVSSSELTIKHFKSYTKCPDDITVIGTTASGVPATNPAIAAFLNHASSFGNCATITDNAPSVFHPGNTPVTFTITDHSTVTVQCTANVKVIAKHDECATALRLYACDKTITDNFCATASSHIPAITGYSGQIKDVWFKIYPSYSSLSVETYQVPGGLTNTVMQAFSGTCGHLHEIESDDSSGDGDHAKITITNLPNLNPIYIKVTDYGANNSGQFGILYKKYSGSSAHIFDAYNFVSGDGSGVHEHPTLTGDVDGDGKTDLIFPFYYTNNGLTIRTKMSNGDGTYTPYEDILGDGNGVFQHPTLTGDVNGDGKTDLIFPFSYGSHGLTIRTKISNGDGTYTPYQDILGDGNGVFQYPTLTGDVNGDGKTDLLFPFYYANHGLTIRTKMSNGDGTYTAYQDILGDGNGVFQYPTLTGDVNGDGKTDLIFAFSYGNQGLTIRTKISNGDGTFSPYQDMLGDGSGVFQYPTLTGDVNGDGKTDLIFPFYFGTHGLTIRTKMSNGDGTYTSYQDILGDGNGVFQYPTLTGDVNGDGKTDLIFAGQNWKGCGLNIRAKISNGDGTWCKDWQLMGDGSGVHQYPTLAGDMNGDGKTDLIFMFHDDNNGLTIRTKIAESAYLCSGSDSIPGEFDERETDDSVHVNAPYIIYPNPTNGYIEIMAGEPLTFNVRVFDMTGSVLLSYDAIENSKRLDVTSIPNGIYFIEIIEINSGNRVVNKIVKIN